MYNLFKTKIGNKVEKKINLKYCILFCFVVFFLLKSFTLISFVWNNTSCICFSQQKYDYHILPNMMHTLLARLFLCEKGVHNI